MIKFDLLPSALCRTPLFPYNSSLEEVWDDLKKAIQEASPDLYRLIADTSNTEIGNLDPKIRFACWKYFNRARYRATPFGAFGAINLIPIEAENKTIHITKKQLTHRFIDWSQKEIKLHDVADILHYAQWFCLNNSLYPFGKGYRYISVFNNTFELSFIHHQEVLHDLFDFVKIKRHKEDLYHFLESRFRLLPRIAEDLLLQLIEAQVLITDIHPNIIGTDYFERLHIRPQHLPAYAITERKRLHGALGRNSLKQISEALSFVFPHLPTSRNKHLENFKQDFLQRFESTFVPLMQALDPELGVGYGELENHSLDNELIEGIMGQNNNSPDLSTLPYTDLHQFILNKLMAHETEINLAQWNPSQKKESEANLLPANTINALVQFADEKIILDMAGGSTANALLGRFTLASTAIAKTCAHITQLEERANPGILFFDIGYQAEKNVDNVNRRKRIYTHEVPILCWSENDDMLSLKDIWVGVQNGALILYSKSQAKRLVPRLASAYNYTRSDLAVYRFLSDLQSQHLRTNLSIKLIDLFPNLDYYPSFRYKQVIFSPRMWKVPVVITTSKHPIEKDLPLLSQWLKNKEVPRHFKCGNGDQQLHFDGQSLEELHYFLQYCRGKIDLYIQEVFIPQVPVIRDEDGAPYLEQLIVTLSHPQPLYTPPVKTPSFLHPSEKRIILPGKEWLYFELYLHPARSNQLLCQSIAPLLKHFRKELKSWFFIRYNHPALHIRLRLQVRHQEDTSLLLKAFSEALEKDVQTGLIREVQLKTYNREIERYGENKIEEVEQFFYLDSRYALKLLHRRYPDEQLYLLSMGFIIRLFQQLEMGIPEQLNLVKQMGDALAQEMHIQADGFRKINTHYQMLQTVEPSLLPKALQETLKRLLLFAQNLLSTVENSRRGNMLIDLIHLHINRLFISEQRKHELFIYQFLFKYLLKENTLKTRYR